MRMTITLIILIVVVLTIRAFSGANDVNSPQIQSAITIAVSTTPLSAPFYIAESEGYFQEYCGEVIIKDVIGGKKSFQQVVNGKADMGTSSGSVIVFQGMKRRDFVSLATFTQSDNDVKIIGRKLNNMRQTINISGKKVGVTKGASGEYLLSTYLALSGLTTEDVIVRYFSPDKLPQALIDNEVDYIVAWEPYAFETNHRLNDQVTTLNTKNLNTLMFNLITAPLNNSHKLARATCVLKSLNAAIEFIATHPDDAKATIIKRIDANDHFIDWVWPDYIFKLTLNKSLLMHLKSQAKWMVKSELVEDGEVPDYKLLLDHRPLALVDNNAVQL
ncbi:hypothetical protein CW745_02650 [Psychromonas sp. psych-6C06]|uniref:ABC transporter substrate-binding protein n=1 Tax=Psychromonas sp. psych-6C06 TaxID=2058089 RepID=UPI000C333081|nr:ABC transporter substrate-binding protein [Psychromonas sp. psych-6C06]PKF63758.1 hypothetical protein CW745_02650 [Psychromonas sp. psych-6C06]